MKVITLLIVSGIFASSAYPIFAEIHPYYLDLTGSDGAAAKPGNPGGDATFSTSDILPALNGDQTRITVISNGGEGGNGGEDIKDGSGGNGGNLDITIDTTLQSEIVLTPAISITANGGATGSGNTSSGSGYLSIWPITTAGGTGGAVALTIAQTGSLLFAGVDTSGISLTADGGDGGDGASVDSFLHDDGYAGTGDNGGQGGTVNLTVDGKITSTNLDAGQTGIVLTANGGDGGNGGADTTFFAPVSGPSGAAGDAGTVTVNIGKNAVVQISSNGVPGIIAQANGGKGGDAGYNDNGTDGNDGSNGGNGGDLFFTNSGSIATGGDRAPAVTLESVGGNGGDGSGGGFNGGTGGKGGDITFTNSGDISTIGDHSFGIVLQSVGGTGGNGGDATFHGGDGGDSKQAGKVTVTGPDSGIAGSITTGGVNAIGIIAQSIGGGNASAALQIANEAAHNSDSDASGGDASGWLFSEGGNGGTGGDAAEVSIQNSSAITTEGSNATAILAQSVGGGGGSGGNDDDTGAFISIGYAGDGSPGGAGSDVYISDAIDADQGTHYDASISTSGISASGIEAFSIGGSGGMGGAATSDDYALGLGINIGKGGAGGSGNDAGAVTVDYYSDITTENADSSGIVAVSIGGGGGKGGQASTLTSELSTPDIPSASVNIGIAGNGGSGASGGEVMVTSHGLILTTGMQSRGIYASSIGGGGGVGANALTQTNTYGGGKEVNFGVSVGGNGGEGGMGGDVTVNVDKSSLIVTNGFASDGVHAVSVGGGGGDAGTGASAIGTPNIKIDVAEDIHYLSLSNSDNFDTNISIGGSGGKGNHGGTVNVTNDGAIITGGSDSRGIIAYSIGGGGGSGASGASSSAQKINLGVSIGGSGGSGSDGDTVTVTNSKNASITTNGDGSHGIHALSVGAGGGVGGTSTADSEFDRLHEFVQGKIEGYLGNTDVAKKGLNTIKNYINNKLKASAPGVADDLKGYLGDNDNEDEDDGMPSMSFNFDVGGAGGAGGKGKAVTVTNDGEINTYGDVAFGIYAQSIGGGGGAGGIAGQQGTTFEKDLQAADPFDNTIGVGGSNGANGDGGTVTITHTGALETDGNSSFGITAQSIGGGGGMAVLATTDTTFGLDIVGQLGSFSTDGSSSHGGAVTVNIEQAATIETQGIESHGVVAQSIGGGGGLFLVNPSENDGSASVAVDPDFVTEIENILMTNGVDLDALKADYVNSLNNAQGTIELKLGSDWSNTGNGGTVIVNHDGSITTHGNNAFGILAQSIGGGGGLASDGAGTNTQQTVTGYLGSGYGDSANVSVELGDQASIKTYGNGAVGIFAQAIGGGGGYTGAFEGEVDSLKEFLSAAPGGGANQSAKAGKLSIVMANDTAHAIDISTTGDYAHGIYAQTLANGGGAVGSSDGITIHHFSGTTARTSDNQSGTTGNTIINLIGDISATGEEAVGIFAQNGIQSTSGMVLASKIDSYGSIQITHQGNITGGDGRDSSGIWIDGGNNSNSINFSQGTLSAQSGNAITLTNTGLTTINNNSKGIIIGSIISNTGSPAVTLNNNASASYYPGQTINLNGGQLTNSGVFDIAGPGVIGSSQLDGTFVQTATGVWNVDLNGRTMQNDSLSMNAASSAPLLGEIKPKFVANGLPSDLSTLNGSKFTFLTDNSLAEIDFSNLKVSDKGNSSIVNFSIVRGETFSVEVQLQASVDPIRAAKSLTDVRDNEGSSASYLNDLINTSGAHSTSASNGELGEHILHLLNMSSPTEYRQALQDMSPEVHTVSQANAAQNASSFQKSLHSIPVFVGDTAQLSEASGAYAHATYTHLSHNNSQQIAGYDQDDNTFHFGGQQEFNNQWYLGGGLNFTDRNLSASNGQSSGNGDYYSGGAVVKKILDESWLLSGSLGFTYGEMDYSRLVSSGGVTRTASSTQKNYIYSGRLRGAYNFDMGMWYIRPGSNIDVMHLNIPAYTETGGGALNMHFNESNLTQVGLNPEVEIGGRIDFADSVLRPYGRFGAEWWSNSNHSISSRLASTPAGSPSLTTSYEGDDWVGSVEIGVDLIKADAAEFRLQYNLDAGENFMANSVSFRVGLLF
ncbi:autotransporter outer membrane beta-barrel domain-containing protein [Cerasicoccus maritimus]|uniref:autotransporter outer membrane beta-barrel domain-containing protein n=1 Tax=Cerasicoccus maritimus TaxID=490089 RepID=UPI0028529DED|nr:autotransporter outer membrane beta-barrel domain-containing protein [Cerasicoccus maritimus]